MIAPNVGTASLDVVRNRLGFAHLMGVLRDEAAMEIAVGFDGISGKRIDSAGMIGFGRHGVSRAMNGSDTNPLYRIAGMFVLMKRLGLSRARAQRIVDWLQEIVNDLWPEEEADADLDAVLDEDQELDTQDDHLRYRASHGCVDAKLALIEVKRRQMAHSATVIFAIRRRLSNSNG